MQGISCTSRFFVRWLKSNELKEEQIDSFAVLDRGLTLDITHCCDLAMMVSFRMLKCIWIAFRIGNAAGRGRRRVVCS